MTLTNTAAQPAATSIDLVNPAQACQHLGVTSDELLRLVNEGRVAAYNLAGQIRFRVTDVSR